jgi:signal transduction histidine kinase
VARLVQAPGPKVQVVWPDEVLVPAEVEPLAQSVLAEALRNIAKHANASVVGVVVARDDDTFSLEVRNDGVNAGARGAGMGLRLAAFEALQHGGVVDFGAPGEGSWRVRLVVPVTSEARI